MKVKRFSENTFSEKGAFIVRIIELKSEVETNGEKISVISQTETDCNGDVVPAEIFKIKPSIAVVRKNRSAEIAY